MYDPWEEAKKVVAPALPTLAPVLGSLGHKVGQGYKNTYSAFHGGGSSSGGDVDNTSGAQQVARPGTVAIDDGSNPNGTIASPTPNPGAITNSPSNPAPVAPDPNKAAFAQALLDQLKGTTANVNAAAAGNGPGAQMLSNQLKQAAQSNAMRGASLAASTKGVNPALAAKMSLDQAAAGNQNALATSGNLALQNQIAAQGQQVNLLGGLLNAGNQSAGLQNNLDVQALKNQGTLAAGKQAGATQLENGIIGGGLSGLGAVLAAIAGRGGGTTTPDASTADTAASAGDAGDAGVTVQDVASGASAAPTLRDNTNPGAPQSPAAHVTPVNPMAGFKTRFSDGGAVKGKAQVSGDSPKNDTVDAKLSPGEIVIPRSAADDPDKAHRFVAAIMDKKQARKGGGYGKVLQAKRELEELKSRMSVLEGRVGGSK